MARVAGDSDTYRCRRRFSICLGLVRERAHAGYHLPAYLPRFYWLGDRRTCWQCSGKCGRHPVCRPQSDRLCHQRYPEQFSPGSTRLNTGAGAAHHRISTKGKTMSGNPISCHLITWGDHFEQGLREVEELGFHACEPFPRIALAYEQHPEAFQELLATYHLRLSALYGGGRFSNAARRQEVIAYNTRLARFLAAIGVDRLALGPGGPLTPGGSTDEEWREAAKTLNETAGA